MKILVAKCSEIGGRERNEDFYKTGGENERSFFALADGLGGHGLGDVAAKTACYTAINYLVSYNGTLNNDIFRDVYEMCQREIYRKQNEQKETDKMRTTLSLVCIDSNIAYWSHIGDSRIYFFEHGDLIKRTLDHSVSQMLASAGEISDSEIRFHEDRNRLLKVLGVNGQEPDYEAEEPVGLFGNQQFLLCSDGFWELITEEQMTMCLHEAEEPRHWLDKMMEVVHNNGRDKETDNITAIAVWILEDK